MKQLSADINNRTGYKNYWGPLYGSSSSLAISTAAVKHKRTLLVICSDLAAVQRLEAELQIFLPSDIKLTIFPDWETLPYDKFSPHQDIVSERLLTLNLISQMKHGVIIVAATTLMQNLPPCNYINNNSFVIQTGQELDLTLFRNSLIEKGYYSVEQVMEHGEFAIRGSIIDLYPAGSEQPLRIDLFDNEIDSIHTFDPSNQKSTSELNKVTLIPARETPLTDEAVSNFALNWQEQFKNSSLDSPIYQSIINKLSFPGVEYYLPLFFNQTATLFDYIPDNSHIILPQDLSINIKNHWHEINQRYEQLAHDISSPILKPTELFLSPEQLFAKVKKHSQTIINPSEAKDKEKYTSSCFITEKIKNISLDYKLKKPANKLKKFLQDQKKPTLFCADSLGRRERIISLLGTIDVTPTIVDSYQQFAAKPRDICITVAPIEQSFSTPLFSLISEQELFGYHNISRNRDQSTTINQDPDSAIHNLAELSCGDPVVHIQYGVGRYLGLQTIDAGGISAEYLTIEYTDQTKLYVPISSLNLISRYLGSNQDTISFSKLGSDQWDKSKSKAIEKIRDTAADLLDIYAKREATKGYAFNSPDEAYIQFAEQFPFEPTPDQKIAIDQVINDMTSSKCMDRLVCGDVGFGKTEVAMRAAFVAAQSSKQVAILVPTTLLTKQHLANFQDRFAKTAINIASLSRFNTATEQKNTLKELAAGKIDIVIGTHKIIQSNIKFNNLGLVIIDEEHRFGVRQKEQLKALRNNIDILSLTATPIPRTLSMAFSGIRDLSIIATPPAKRLAIKTFIKEHNDALIREAIMREIMRGGQAYFIHNDIDTIEATCQQLKQLIPEAKIKFAHGQMREKELESIMSDFYHLRFNVLIATTIIESGIDIPTANTMIINNADRFGLAQLHQLRGRIGRSHHQAYAYLLLRSLNNITKDAKKRMEAIDSMGQLGVGFMLATQDLEIRGAGEILGDEQSGQIQTIGYNLYMEFLNKAVKNLKQGKLIDDDTVTTNTNTTEIELAIPCLLPDNYVANVNTRLILYKRISSAQTTQELRDIQIELIDRFGLMPQATKNLIAATELKLAVSAIGINKIKANRNQGYLEFNDKPKIDNNKLIRLIQAEPNIYQLTNSNRLQFKIHDNSDEGLINTINSLYNNITK
jgi:transcription-repair coupling factor (superfamily II helicase)